MSQTAYKIAEHVWGELHTPAGPLTFDLEPGETIPKDAAEAEVLAHLVATGRAELVTPARSAKKKEA